MYDKEVTESYLSQLDPHITIRRKSGDELIPFSLTYHSPSEVGQIVDHFNNLIDLELYNNTCTTSSPKIVFKKPNYQFSQEELVLIENERILTKWDCNYYLTRYFKHLDAQGIYRRFDPLIPQLVNMRILARLQRAKRALRKLTVKARQQGETTWSQGVISHRLLYFSDVVSMIASLDSTESAKLAEKFMGAVARIPYFNRPFIAGMKTGDFYKFANGSFFDLGWGTQESLGRGRTPLIAHLSELPFYKFFQKAIIDSLFNAMHESIWMMQLLEGTAENRDDDFHKLCKETQRGMEAGTTSMVFCFHPWCARRDLFPTEAWMEARKEYFADWVPSTETLIHAKKLENWVRTNEDYRETYKELKGGPFKLEKEQLFYYEVEKNEAIKRGKLASFLKEKPSDPEEAFQNAQESIYPIQTIIAISDEAQGKIPDVYKLRGDPSEVNPVYFPDEEEIDYEKSTIVIRARWNASIPYSQFELVPIIFRGWDNFDPTNKFIIWEHPIDNVHYGFGVDDSDGLGRGISDDAVFEIIKKGTISYKDKQVCEFSSPEIPPSQLWPFSLAIATYYSPTRQVLFIPETMKGRELLNGMLNRGWSNVYGDWDSAKIGQQTIAKFGFSTNVQSRQEVVNLVHAFIKGNWIELYSMELVKELKALTKRRTISPVLGRINEKILGKNDNRFMALGITLYALHRDEILGLEKAAWEYRRQEEESQIVFKSYEGAVYEEDDGEVTYNPDLDETEIYEFEDTYI